MKQNKLNTIKWIARIFSILILLVGVPLYCGYGNPLPFASSEYDFYDNLWRAVFPLMFVGLVAGWKYEKVGGYLVIIGILTRFFVSIIIQEGLSLHLSIPFIIGILYLVVGYNKNKTS